MAIPRWLVFVLAAWVSVFGAYRLWVAFKKDGKDPKRSHWNQISVFGRSKRAHAIYGVLYLLLGGMLIATGLGVDMPFAKGCRSIFEKQQAVPETKDGRQLELQKAPAPE